MPPIVLAGLVALVAVAVVVTARSSTGDYLPQVPEGVSYRTVDGQQVFLVRDGDYVRAFSPDARHVKGETVVWCPVEEVFASLMHGEQFDRSGRVIAGPARGGLVRFPLQGDGERLAIDTQRAFVVAGTSPQSVDPVSEDGNAWNAGPGSFCNGPEPASLLG